MKKKINKLIINADAILLEYRTYRSDMGCQVYNIIVKKGNDIICFQDSYFIGNTTGQEYILNSFKLKLNSINSL